MADKKISELTPVTVPSATDELVVNQSGTSKKITLGQIRGSVVMEFLIDGNGSAITAGVKGDIVIPFTGNFTTWTLLADQTGSIVLDLWKDTYANFPPTNADALSTHPTISSATKATGSITDAVTAGDILRVNAAATPSAITRATLILEGN